MFDPLATIGVSMEIKKSRVKIEKDFEAFIDSLKLEAIQIPRTAKETVARTVIFGTEIQIAKTKAKELDPFNPNLG